MGRPPRRPIPMEEVIDLAFAEATRSGVSFEKLMGKCRKRDIAKARWRVFAMLRAKGYSLPQIAGPWLMDHTSVLHGLREHDLLPTDRRAQFERFEACA